MDVEVDLYAGRPNPRVALPGVVAGDLARRLGALPVAPGTDEADEAGEADAAEEGLGYRGLLARGEGLPGEVRVGGGRVTVHEPDGGRRVLLDAGRELERWLLERAGPQLDDELRAWLEQQLGP